MEDNKYLQLLIEIIDKKDPYKSGHSRDVAKLSIMIARKIEIEKNIISDLKTGALLHDLGKILLPGELWCIPEELDQEEKDIVRKHPRLGADLLDNCNFNTNIIDIVKYHHEWWDGNGYPEQLQGAEIPVLARIVALAEAFISIISYEIYSPGLEREEAIEKINKRKGTQFDPEIVQAFLNVIEDN